VLFVVLAGLMLVTDPMGFLSTDVGGKIATLEAMDRSGSLSPDLGYWAEAVDPDGHLYPMFSTVHVDGKWVNVTSLPMLLVALPLYKVGGALAAGLIPVLGTLLAAFGARALAQRLGRDDQSDEMTAFWIVGLASPATVYALDFWEHSLGLALILWAVVFALDAAPGDGRARSALAAGLLFGIAAAMRQEALVYGFVAGGALGLRVLMSGRVLGAAFRSAAMLAGFAAMTAANSVLESAIIGDATRTGRSTSTAARAGGDLGLRAEEAVLTFAAPFGRTALVYLIVAFITVGALAELGRRSEQMELPLRPVLLVLGSISLLLVLNVVSDGLAFVPGLIATTPVAGLAIAKSWGRADHRMVGSIALVSLPLVWAVQYTGGASPQWGGRYILATGALLVVVATVTMTEGRAREVLRGTAIAGAAVTLIGVAWTIERTHSFADAMNELADRDEPALVFHDPHLAREGGVLVLDEQWLVATGASGRERAAEALADLGIDSIGFVQHDRGDDPLVLPGWTVVNDDRIPLVSGLFVRVTTQEPIR
jgi:hypothetical protein